MKKLLVSLIVLFFFANISNAQSAKVVYAELGGPGVASINYDMRFSPKENGFGFRVGVGGWTFGKDDNALFIPLGLNYITSKDSKNYLEVGGGVTVVSGTFDSDNFGSTFGHLNFGYRLQPKDGGFFFRAAINPIFGSAGFWPFYGGVGFGYKF